MKKIIIFLICSLPFLSIGQNYNPVVWGPNISTAPLGNVASNGTGVFTFYIGNTGDDNLPLIQGQEMKVSIILTSGIPNNVNPLNALSGTYVGYFDWQYDANTNTFTGTQNNVILGADGGTITVDYKVTDNSVQTSPTNGFNVIVTPPAYTNGINSLNDDNINAYTWTVVKTPLTLSFTSFAANISACNNASLVWQTKDEKNISKFEIYRSENNNAFVKIGQQEAQNGATATYNFIDNNLSNGTYLYKIAAINNNGTQDVSKTIEIKIICGGNKIDLFPNPSKTETNLQIESSENSVYTVNIMDALGKVILNKEFSVTIGNNLLNIPTKNFANGIYNVIVSNGTESKLFKLQKVSE